MNFMNKYSVITTSFRNSTLKEVQNPVDDIEYIVITDNPHLTSKTWKVVLFEDYEEVPNEGLLNFYVNLFCFNYCNTDMCIILNNNIQIKSDFSNLISYLIKQNYEYVTPIGLKYSMSDIINENIQNYLTSLSYDLPKIGTNDISLIIKQNTYFTKTIDKEIWKLIKEYPNYYEVTSLSPFLTQVLYTRAYNSNKIALLSFDILYSNWFTLCLDDNKESSAYYIHDKYANTFKSLYDYNYKYFYHDDTKPIIKYTDIELNKNPLITIVITCFNKETTIKRAINSVKSMNYDNWECIIVDNDSEDNSFNIILENTDEDERFTVIRQRNKNVCNSRNVGAFEGNGKYLTFLDGDDVIGKNFCSMCIHEMEKNPKCCIGTGIFLRKYLNNTTQYFCTDASCFNDMSIRDRFRIELLYNMYTVTSIMLLDRFKKSGGFREGTEYTTEDWEMFVRYFYEDLDNSETCFVYDDNTNTMYMQKESKTTTQNLNWTNYNAERLEEYNENPNIYEEFFSAEEIEKIKKCMNF